MLKPDGNIFVLGNNVVIEVRDDGNGIDVNAVRNKAIERGTDIVSTDLLVELSAHRVLVQDTDLGYELRSQINDLKQLLYAYRNGFLKQHEKKA